ncbi:MAG TPA: roadblock/LC7 domain-containing protein [Firmicutes bacterium]|nr:roadblock/LC7 domain-containing protein [Bacillota bacterium]
MKIENEQMEQLEEVLSELIWKTSSKSVFLVDINGELIAIAGYTGNINAVALASLSASHFAATVALARMLSEKQFTVLFHKGLSENIDINRVGNKLLLITIFGQKTVLGILREETEKTIQKINDILSQIPGIEEKPIKKVNNTLRDEINNLLKDM